VSGVNFLVEHVGFVMNFGLKEERNDENHGSEKTQADRFDSRAVDTI
jgi:hypothetical protein